MNHRSIRWIVLALIALPLAACSREDADRERAEAAAIFEEAQQHLRRVQSGVIHEPVADPGQQGRQALEAAGLDPSAKEHNESIREYRQSQLKQAAEKLQPLTGSGSPAQRLAALRLVAETHASAARLSQEEATRAWPEQGALLSELRGFAAALRRAHASATAHSEIDRSEALAELRSTEERLTGEEEKLADRVEELQQKIDSQQEEIKRFKQRRREKTKEAEKLSREAFQAEGQAGFDLHRKASGLEREADKLAAKAEKAEAKLDVDQKQLRLLEIELENTRSRIEDVRASIKALQQRQDGTDELTEQRQQRVTDLTDRYQETFEKLAAQQQERIDKPFETAAERFNQAVEQLEQAAQVAPRDSSDRAQLDLAARRTELGLALQEQAEIHAAYRDALRPIAKGLRGVLPERSGAAADVADEADTRAAEATDRAVEQLNTAAEQLTEIADQAESANEAGMERPARRHLLQIYQTLDRVEDADHADRIEQQRQRLNALQPGDKEAAEEEPSAPSDGGGDAEATSDDSSDSNSGSGNGEASDEGGESEESSSGEEG